MNVQVLSISVEILHCLKDVAYSISEGKMNWSRRHEANDEKLIILFNIDHLTINSVEKYKFKLLIAWRLVTNFLFFGPLGFSFFFNMLFVFRYCRMLEEGSFRGRTADFVFMFLFGGVLMILLGLLGSLFFLGQALTAMLVYVWSRRSPRVRVNFFGLLTFQAPFLPWALMGFSLLLGNSILVDLLGIAVGHIYYFLEDVFPNQPGGKRLLLTPSFLKLLLDAPEEDPNYLPLPEEQPGPLQQ